MRKLTIRSLWEHKRRLVSTVLAIVLGVAFMSGTFVFADTINQAFDDLFDIANEEVDARVQGEVIFSGFNGDQRARFDEELLDTVQDVDGVAAAVPAVVTFGGGPTNRILDANGEAVGASNGPPTIIENFVDDERLSAYELTEGSRGPEADDEIALNVAAAEDGNFSLGDEVTLTSPFGNATYTLVGTFRFGDADSAAGTVAADFTLAEAQRLAGAPGQLDNVFVAAEEGISQEEITRRIASEVPAGTEVITGEASANQDADSVQEGLAFFQQILSIFGTIALLVGSFIIANTFQILVAQRTRELALLRALGASRRQVLGSVLLEAGVVGLVASVLGILTGIGLAVGITALLNATGVDLPSSGLVVSPATVILGLVIGLVVTVVAAIWPAIKATRVPPLAALRDVAIERPGASKIRIVLGLVVLVLSAFGMSAAWQSDGDTDSVPTVGLGAVLLIVGAIIVGPVLAGPTVNLLGGLLPRLRGVTGRLATDNAARAPKRTSATASALLIAVALIGFITVFAESAKKSVASEVNRGIKADVVVQPSGGAFGSFIGFTPEIGDAVAETDGVDTVGAFAADEAHITYPDGDTADTFAGAVLPSDYLEVATPKMEEGSLDDLEPGQVIVDRQIAEDNDLQIGSEIGVDFPGGGHLDVEVSAISDDLVALGYWTFHRDDFEEAVDQYLEFQVFASIDDGADIEAVKAELDTVLEPYSGIAVLDRDEFIGDVASQLTAFVNVIYGLLALSIIIAMIGVANTLSLSVHERTRELGLLRAVGMTRSQVRSAVRWEAVIIAVLGTLVGLGVGLISSFALVKALEGFGLTTFAVPIGALVIWVIVLAALGVLASLRTAWKAAKLDILAAIAHE